MEKFGAITFEPALIEVSASIDTLLLSLDGEFPRYYKIAPAIFFKIYF